jgi:triacylglycerol lipase
MKSQAKIQTIGRVACIAIAIAFVATTAAQAQVPRDVAAKLVEIGKGVCVPQTAKLYAPLQPKPPASGITIVRDISYADDPRTIMDVFSAEKGGGSRPVLVYVSGGAGDKKVNGPDGEAFYDNIMFWAVKNGMVGVNMQRRGGFGGGLAWDEPAKDVGRVVDWIRQNITKYKGNPNRIFLWADSAGNVPVSTYAAHPEIHGEGGESVKGIVLMSSPNFSIAPETVPPIPGGAGIPACAGAEPRGGGAGRGAGAPGAGRGGGRGAPAPLDEATQLARSNLNGLAKGKIAVFVGWGELDPPNIVTFDEALKAAMCKTGKCPTTAFFKDHSHVSLVFSPNTADDSVTGPILKWMKGVK